ncbi:MAG: LacI family DNA-binding transcriptional regulator [Lachnospiraceae bacterium]|nr:LacI family DNA-binding transcriptional regulator [Lachnospiraceae bacterium]
MSGIREIAERAGVSISTVSNVLHNKNSASPKTRERSLRSRRNSAMRCPCPGSGAIIRSSVI